MHKKHTEYKVFVWDNIEEMYATEFRFINEWIFAYTFFWKTTMTIADFRWFPQTIN